MSSALPTLATALHFHVTKRIGTLIMCMICRLGLHKPSLWIRQADHTARRWCERCNAYQDAVYREPPAGFILPGPWRRSAQP